MINTFMRNLYTNSKYRFNKGDVSRFNVLCVTIDELSVFSIIFNLSLVEGNVMHQD